ncbi:hypothetical protein CFOL_v3_27633 [Cephalotus follicularis]|uniref:ZC3H15/TMA46 family C-terminal domain-containing protein n=1 Tax=Cephalotus follicularis TaxID=3775 RepID=A0A1Q3CVB8_CEPFO|nr:hypothetical protein CFOL_v3_27633 [Cephalotus follicularis]
MEDWDQETLEKVVESKNKEYGQNKPTDIRSKIITSTPMTPELFMKWKKKKMAERDANLASQMADRTKNDRMSGRELFMSDSSWFVDDAEAYENYQREEESDSTENKVNDKFAAEGQSTSATADDDAAVPFEDGDELDMDELNELEASLAKTSIQIQERNSTT